MMQVVDRWSQAGPSSANTTTMTVNSPLTSPKKASGFSASPRTPTIPEDKSSPFHKSALWLRGSEENAMARTQQFLIETHKTPLMFKPSEAPISSVVPYPPINDANLAAEKAARLKSVGTPERIASTSAAVFTTSDKVEESVPASLPSKESFPHRISLHPPKEANERGIGLYNKGNTCYMNSTLQALLHLPPLSHALLSYDDDQLYGVLGARPLHKFDAIGEMKSLAERVLTRRGGGQPTAPMAFLTNLKLYARTLSKFRQEDAHEFLRFLLEAMQYCCLLRAPKSMKPTDPMREATLIYKIFGGKLRSRVQCQRCKNNSDTFDPILDLSLDLKKSSSINEALERFTSADVLTGSEKYRCEKCKRAVDATKWFTIHEAPTVLTIHLKRFTPGGQKINRQIHYPDSLVLTKDMLSEGSTPQHYRLRSIVHHHGHSPNSGHYVASVKGNGSNRWYEMNDSNVYPSRGTPINISDAYILFYVRDPSYALSNVVNNNRKRSSETQDNDDNWPRRRDNMSPPTSMLKKKKKPLVSSLSTVRSSPSGISPGSFYASPTASTKSALTSDKQKAPIFRNLNTGTSDDDDKDDDENDVGEKVHSSANTQIAPFNLNGSSSSTTSNNFNSSSSSSKVKSKKRKHRNSLSLGIRAGNQKSNMPYSPYKKIGQDNLQKQLPLHARMKDKHGNQQR